MTVFFLADGRLQADRLFGDLQDLAHLVLGVVHLVGDFLGCGLATELLNEGALGADEFVDGFDHVHRNTDGAGLIGDGARDGLTNPPGGVGRELVAAAVFELFDGLHQADVAFLNQVEELQAAVDVLLGDRDDQPEVGLNQLGLGGFGAGLGLFEHAHGLAQAVRSQTTLAFDVADFFLPLAELLADLDHVLFLEAVLLEEAGHGLGRGFLFDLELHGDEVVGRNAETLGIVAQTGLITLELVAQFFETAAEGVDLFALEADIVNQAHDVLVDQAHLVLEARALGFVGAEEGRLEVLEFFLLALDIADHLKRLGQSGVILARHRRVDNLGLFLGFIEVVLGVGVKVVAGVDDVLQTDRAVFQAAADGDDFLDRYRRIDDDVQYLTLAGFDPLGDLSLVFTRKQRNRTHLVQVHPHRIRRTRAAVVMDIDCFFFVFEFFFFVDDLDVLLTEEVHHIINVIRADIAFGQGIVDFVKVQITLCFAHSDQILHLAGIGLLVAHITHNTSATVCLMFLRASSFSCLSLASSPAR